MKLITLTLIEELFHTRIIVTPLRFTEHVWSDHRLLVTVINNDNDVLRTTHEDLEKLTTPKAKKDTSQITNDETDNTKKKIEKRQQFVAYLDSSWRAC